MRTLGVLESFGSRKDFAVDGEVVEVVAIEFITGEGDARALSVVFLDSADASGIAEHTREDVETDVITVYERGERFERDDADTLSCFVRAGHDALRTWMPIGKSVRGGGGGRFIRSSLRRDCKVANGY